MIVALQHGPVQGGAEGFVEPCVTGFADGLQPTMSPCSSTVVLEFTHQKTVREHDEVNVPCLAHTVTKLTIPHA